MVMKILIKFSVVLFFILTNVNETFPQNSHPNLIINQKDVKEMQDALGKYPLFDEAFQEAKQVVENALIHPIDVPVPKDAGGYAHERHKKNLLTLDN